jgi:hypothetical protein
MKQLGVRLTLPSPKERVLKREAQVLSFGEDLGEATKMFMGTQSGSF